MKEVIDLYKKHREMVENYVNAVLKSIPDDPVNDAKAILQDIPSLTSQSRFWNMK